MKALAYRKVRVKVLETYIVHKGIIEAKVYTDNLGCVKNKKYLASEQKTTSEKLSQINDQHTKSIRNLGEKVAIIDHRNGRSFLNSQAIQDYIQKSIGMPSILSIQKMVPHLDDQHGIYNLKVYYINHEYITEFFVVKENTRKKLKNKAYYQELKDIGIVILTTIEEVEMKRVVHLDLEFIRDERGIFWFLNSKQIKMIEPSACILREFETVKEIDDLVLQNIKNNTFVHTEDEISERLLESKYVIKRGQLRNKGSKLSSPIRVRSPRDSSEDELTSEPNKYIWSKLQQTIKAKLLAVAVLSTMATKKKKSRIGKRRNTNQSNFMLNKFIRSSMGPETIENSQVESTVNSNFLELASKTMIKNRLKIAQEPLSKIKGFEYEENEVKRGKQRILEAVKNVNVNRSVYRNSSKKQFDETHSTIFKTITEDNILSPKVRFNSSQKKPRKINTSQSSRNLRLSGMASSKIIGSPTSRAFNIDKAVLKQSKTTQVV